MAAVMNVLFVLFVIGCLAFIGYKLKVLTSRVNKMMIAEKQRKIRMQQFLIKNRAIKLKLVKPS